MNILRILFSKVLSKLGGPISWIAGLILDKIFARVTQAIADYIAKQKQDKADKEAEKKYNEEIKKPNETLEDRKKSTDDFLNGNGG